MFGEKMITGKNITTFIPTSPISIHPFTEMIEEVVDSIQLNLPDTEIIIMADGIRDEVSFRKEQYEEYLERLKEKVKLWGARLELFPTPTQQTGMLNSLIEDISRPILMFVEHDCPLRIDIPINWYAIISALLWEEVNLVRFYWQKEIHPEHLYLTGEKINLFGETFLKTQQYSGWPHLASVKFYKQLLRDYYEGGNHMLESLFYGPFIYKTWEEMKMVIYHPENKTIQGFTHLNGRGIDNKTW